MHPLRARRGARRGRRRPARCLLDIGHQAIALSPHRLDLDPGRAGQGPANEGDVVLKVVLLDDHVRPQPLDQRLLPLEQPRPFHEQAQRLERLARQRHELPVTKEPSFRDLETKWPERIDPGGDVLIHCAADESARCWTPSLNLT
jgi:hypothetical protein